MPLIILPKPFNVGFLGVSVPIITTQSLPGAIVATPYSSTFAAAGGTQPYRWLITADSGSGLTLNAITGILSGVVASAGNFSIVVQVTDANGVHAISTFTLNAVALLRLAHPEIVEISWLPIPDIVRQAAGVPIQPQCATPTLSPLGGSGFAPPQTITISDGTAGAAIYYTTDGSTPAVVGGVPQGTTQTYTAPFSISIDTTVNAIATKTGFLTSAVGTAVYNLTLTPLWP